jgi:hypothetical protein
LDPKSLSFWLAAQIEREDDALEYRTIGVLEMEELAGRDGGPGGKLGYFIFIYIYIVITVF